MTSPAIEAQSAAARPARSTLTAAALQLARARLVQFVVLGGAIFLVAPRPRDDRRIEISQSELAIVESAEAARHGTTRLEPAKVAEITARLIEDKMLFAEGVRLGLDRDDPIIRQRVVQKVLLLAEEVGGATREPTRAELRTEYQRSQARYRQPPQYHLMQVFAARREDLPPREALATDALPSAGEPFPLPRETHATRGDLKQAYGAAFADAVAGLAPGSGYSEPVASSFGWHRVRVVDVTPGRVAPFEQVEHEVAFDLILARREDTVRTFLAQTAARYDLVVGGQPLVGFTPSLRLARREAPSGED